MRRTKWVAMNGAGILPEFQGRGGNALLYSEMEKTVSEFGFEHADLTQVAETAVQMRSDLVNLGGKLYKTHRVYGKEYVELFDQLRTRFTRLALIVQRVAAVGEDHQSG